MRRRCVLRAVMVAPAMLFHGVARADTPKPKPRPKTTAPVVWRLPAQSLDTAKRYIGPNVTAQAEPEGATDKRGLPIILIVSAVALIPQLAEAIVHVYRDYKNGGVVIVRKGEGLDVSTDPKIPADTIVVLDQSGVKIYDRKNPDAVDLGEVLGSLVATSKK